MSITSSLHENGSYIAELKARLLPVAHAVYQGTFSSTFYNNKHALYVRVRSMRL